MIEIVVEGIGVCAVQSKPVVILRKKRRESFARLVVKQHEADAIALGLTKSRTPRPLTHELVLKVIRQLGARLDCVMLNEGIEEKVVGYLILRQGGRRLTVECRPGDALALAVRSGAPTFAEERLLEHYAVAPGAEEAPSKAPEAELSAVREDEPNTLDAFRDFINSLDLDGLG
jgi:uncharacterized protein